MLKKWKVCGLLLAGIMVIMFSATGSVWAQDYKNVERKLGQMVATGDISLEQAMVMMEALKDHDREKIDHERELEEREEAIEEEEAYWQEQEELIEEIWAWIEKEGDALKEAVEAGKMNEGQAWAKWDEMLNDQLAPKLKYLVEKEELEEEMAYAIWGRIMTITKEKKDAARKVSDAQRETERMIWDWMKVKKMEYEAILKKEGFQKAKAYWDNFQRRELAPKMDRLVKGSQISKAQYDAIWRNVKDSAKKALEAEAAKAEVMKRQLERAKKKKEPKKSDKAPKKGDKAPKKKAPEKQ